MTNHDLLTQEEMSSLLEHSDNHAPESGKRRRVMPYNFRRPDRIPREQIRSLYLMHDLFALSLSSSLPILMRAMSGVTLMSVEQQAYSEYLQGLSDPTALFTLSMHPLPGVAALELSPAVAFPVIDRLLGGVGEDLEQPRALSPKSNNAFWKALSKSSLMICARRGSRWPILICKFWDVKRARKCCKSSRRMKPS